MQAAQKQQKKTRGERNPPPQNPSRLGLIAFLPTDNLCTSPLIIILVPEESNVPIHIHNYSVHQSSETGKNKEKNWLVISIDDSYIRTACT